MYGHRGVAEHGFRPSRRKADDLVRTFDWISERPEAAFDGLVIHLIVGDGGLELRIPIDQPLASKDQAGPKEIKKRLPNRAGADGIERKAGARPIAATAQLA